MNEPMNIHAQAGRPPGLRSRALGFLEALVAGAYSPNTFDSRKFGVDLSEYNIVNLQSLADYATPCEYAMIRIGGSASVRDTKFKHYWDAAKAAKIPRSIYTYNWPGWSIDQHIQNFMASVEQWTPGDLGEGPIWADIETHPSGMSRKQISDHAIAYIRALESETGKVVGWYTGPWFVNAYMEIQDWMQDKWAWIATWSGGGQPREHAGPAATTPGIPNSRVVIQQTGSNGDAKLFGGSGRYDTDRWTQSDDLFRELFGIDPSPDPDPDLEKRIAAAELQIKQLQERQAKTDEWANSYGE